MHSILNTWTRSYYLVRSWPYIHFIGRWHRHICHVGIQHIILKRLYVSCGARIRPSARVVFRSHAHSIRRGREGGLPSFFLSQKTFFLKVNKDVVAPPLFRKHVRSWRKPKENDSEIEVKWSLRNFMNLIIWELSCPFPFCFFWFYFIRQVFFLMSLPLPHLKKPRCYMCTVPRSSTARYEKSLCRRTVPKHAVAYSFVLFINKNHMQIHRFDTYVDI